MSGFEIGTRIGRYLLPQSKLRSCLLQPVNLYLVANLEQFVGNNEERVCWHALRESRKPDEAGHLGES